MFNYSIKAGTTDVSVVVRIIDAADGTPETGVLFNTSGIDLEYRRELAASVDITEATLAALTTAHADGGFLHIGNGYYRLDLPDAAVAAGSAGVLVHGVVTGMVVIGCYIQLVAYDPFDTVRLGLTALPNAAAEAAGGLYTRGTGAGQINQPANGRVDANTIAVSGTTQTARDLGQGIPNAVPGAAGGLFIAGTNAATTVTTSLTTTFTGNLTGSVGSVTGAVGSVTGSVGTVNALAANSITAAAFAADAATEIRSLASGTSDSGSTTTMVDAARTEADTDYWNGQIIVFTSGTLLGQARMITGFVPGTDTMTFTPATTQAVSTHTYEIWPMVDSLRSTVAGRTLDVSAGGEAGLDWANIGSPTTAQNLSGTNIDVDQVVASVSGAVGSVTGAVGSVTGNVGGNVTGSVGSVVGAVGSVTGAVGSVSGNVSGNVTGSVGSLAAQAKADVNAEIVDTLSVDVYSEPAQGAPGVSISLAAKINYLYKAFRNKITQTSTTLSIYADDAVTVDHKATVTDDSVTYTRSEISTGP